MLRHSNPHPLDGYVRLDERTHTYWCKTRKGRNLEEEEEVRVPISVTGLLKSAFNTFDAVAVATAGVPRWLADPTHKNHALCVGARDRDGLDDKGIVERVLAEWRRVGDEAAAQGTQMHKQLEDYLEGHACEADSTARPPPASQELLGAYRSVLAWFSEQHPEAAPLTPWRTEFPCVLLDGRGAPALAGTIDCIMRDRHGVPWLLDWKRARPSRKGLLGARAKRPRPWDDCKARAPFEAWDATDYHRYSAQLVAYKQMLEAAGYFERVAGCILVQMHEEELGAQAHCVEAEAALAPAVADLLRGHLDANAAS